MKKITLIAFTILLGLFITPYLSEAQTTINQVSVKITGEVKAPFDINLDSLNKFKQTEVIRKDKEGKDHTYSGVILSDILQKAGVPSGKDLRGKNLTKYVLIDAGDGYQVVFALAELDKDFTDRLVIVADMVDGKTLPAGEGPFRIIVQDEKKPARCIKMITAIKIISAK
ncbi:molybdopterin-dependent oxidoreductase [Mucilaginibacter sp. X5P1]|uniref:molybdopterin-dependent oxidoreductase n=1 Tax=Mucilaginibacter sp. X5P1 TaxID=2723088 RepID=UPI00161C7DB1|nr:molybdopterin-dependent oxidoreductase [Mucilaginibacter sp. X5P1]MBB6137052.1 DMSO/TMAO reductase YedYZ molybdopterin-dependent catalytic subunit [Mucilaginibacter sp. X5P1]